MNRWIVVQFSPKNFRYPSDTAVNSEGASESRFKERNERMKSQLVKPEMRNKMSVIHFITWPLTNEGHDSKMGTEEASSLFEESINEEMSNPSRWPNEELESSHFSDTSNIRSVGFYAKIKNLFDSHLPLSWFLAVAFLGFWLPKKRYSLWLLTLIPVFLLLFGVGAHLYFMGTSLHRSIHIGSKMLLSTLWRSGFASPFVIFDINRKNGFET